MNKAQLIEALSDRLGDKKAAAAAVDGLVDVVVRTVNKGEKVNITGFGVFEKRARAARTARNPRSGAPVKVKATKVPRFRAGQGFKDVVAGKATAPKLTPVKSTAKAATTSKATVSRATTSKATTSKASTAKASTARAAASRNSAPKSTKSTAKAASSRGKAKSGKKK